MDYEIIADPQVSSAIAEINDYISGRLLSPQGAKSTVSVLRESIQILKIFPESGFDVDARIGRQLYPGQKTYGTVTKGGRYLLFYQLIPKNKKLTIIYVSDLISAKTDWLNFFTH